MTMRVIKKYSLLVCDTGILLFGTYENEQESSNLFDCVIYIMLQKLINTSDNLVSMINEK